MFFSKRKLPEQVKKTKADIIREIILKAFFFFFLAFIFAVGL